MTIFVASTENDAARPKEQRQRRDHEAKNRNNNNSERKFPSWTKTQIPKWGTRICVPEWDDDEIIIDDDDDDDDDENDNNNDDDHDDDDDDDDDDEDVADESVSCGCEYGSGGRVEGEAEGDDEYRNRNGWKVREERVVLFFLSHGGHDCAVEDRGGGRMVRRWNFRKRRGYHIIPKMPHAARCPCGRTNNH